MSHSSRVQNPSVHPLSSEVESSDNESITYRSEAFSSPRINLGTATPVKDFKQDLENEKNIRKLLTKLDTMSNIPAEYSNDKILSVLEKNYKLQIQTLLEEVHQLKLDKKLLEKKTERANKESRVLDRSRIDGTTDSFVDDPILRKTLEAKSSTIKELEFQIAQVKTENNALKTRVEMQNRQIEELFERLADAENIKEMLEEKEEELTCLRENLKMEEAKNDKAAQELSYIKNENISMKIKSQNNSFSQQTGVTSFYKEPCNCASKDQSFYSIANDKNTHLRAASETRVVGRILNLSDVIDETKGGSPQYGRRSIFANRLNETHEILTKTSPRNEMNQLQRLSVKVLSDYEKGLKKEQKSDMKKDSKTLDRIIEVNKIKSYYIEAQNKKLLSILNAVREEKS